MINCAYNDTATEVERWTEWDTVPWGESITVPRGGRKFKRPFGER